MDCIFCSIGQHSIDSTMLYETDTVFVIKDLHPKTKVHVLAIPKQHVVTFNDITETNKQIMADLAIAVSTVTADLGIDKTGYKVVANNGVDGGQAVPHLHLHILGGESVKGVT